MNKRRTLIITSVLAILLVTGGLVVIKTGEGSSEKISARTEQVQRDAIIETVDGTGVVAAKPSAELSWESGGYVSGFSLQVGDQVEQGATILTLKDHSKAAEILQAESSLLEAKAELEKMLAADTDLVAALEDVQYQEQLLANKYSMRHEFYASDVADTRIDAVYANYQKAREDVWQLEDACNEVKTLDESDPLRVSACEALQVGILKRDSLLRALSQIMGTPYGQRAEGYFIAYDQQKQAVAESRAAYERLLDRSDEITAARARVQALQNTIDQASIIAPFTGTITAIHSVAGEKVNTGDTAVQLDDLSNLVVELGVSQMDINKIEIGQSANMTFNAVPANSVYTGSVIEISGAGVEDDAGNTRYRVTVALDQPDSRIKPGFNAAVSIIIHQVEDVLLVPNSAIRFDDDGSAYVSAQNDLGGTSNIPIETGARSDAFSELLSGDLEEGDRLAVEFNLNEDKDQSSQPGGMRLPFLNFLR